MSDFDFKGFPFSLFITQSTAAAYKVKRYFRSFLH